MSPASPRRRTPELAAPTIPGSHRHAVSAENAAPPSRPPPYSALLSAEHQCKLHPNLPEGAVAPSRMRIRYRGHEEPRPTDVELVAVAVKEGVENAHNMCRAVLCTQISVTLPFAATLWTSISTHCHLQGCDEVHRKHALKTTLHCEHKLRTVPLRRGRRRLSSSLPNCKASLQSVHSRVRPQTTTSGLMKQLSPQLQLLHGHQAFATSIV